MDHDPRPHPHARVRRSELGTPQAGARPWGGAGGRT